MGNLFWNTYPPQYIISINHYIYRYVYLCIISLSSLFCYHYSLSFPLAPSIFLPWGNCWLPYGRGITVCAIGTSFPNAVASVLMAQQNKPAAAIANALGSNVQNVFLAMALPWVPFRSFMGECLGYVTSPRIRRFPRNCSPPIIPS